MKYLAKNSLFLRQRADLGQVQFGQLLGIHQTSVGRMEKGQVKSTIESVVRLAQYAGVTVDDLLNRDLAVEGAAQASQPAQLDQVRMGLALTSFDKALKDMEIQGQLGTLVEPLLYAYSKAFKVKDPDSREELEHYDELVESHLRGWKSGRGRAVEEGQGEDRAPSTKSKKIRHRK
jgi:DNA-binding XRE family transcriptional regulator